MKEKLTVNELFSGIGSQRAALERLNIPHDVVGIAEIDKYAIQSYEAIYGETRNYGDISVIEKLDYADFWTYSAPCTDWSIAGEQRGGEWTCMKCNLPYNPLSMGTDKRYYCPICGSTEIQSTRSGLLFEVERLLVKSKEYNELPKYLMLENVKNLVSKKFKPYFDEWLVRLDNLGYNTYWQVLNAKDYGVPQNRERVFAISIRKDIDNGKFEFPKPFDNGIRLKDILEDEVDERYYLSKQIQDRFQVTDETFTKNIIGTTKPEFRTIGQRDLVYQENSIMGTLVATDYKQPKQIIEQYDMDKSLKNTRYNIEYANCITAREDCGSSSNFAQQGTAVLETNCIKQVGNYRPDTENFTNPQTGRVYSEDYISPTLNTMQGGDRQPKILNDFKIRKLTPKECWRLMGFSDEAFDKASSVCSNSQLYKQAGNSIVVDVLYYIFKNLFNVETDENFTQPQVD